MSVVSEPNVLAVAGHRDHVGNRKPDELKPFTLNRYRTGSTSGDRNSNCPWV